jgi:hypothetical protein
MDDERTDSNDDRVTSVPLPTNVGAGADKVVAQQNQSPEVAEGSGEWPSPDAPPTGPAPGTTTDASHAAGTGPERRPESPASGDEDGSFPPLKDALEANAVTGGSQAVLDEDDDGGPELQGASRLPGPG